jgi:hypothetical protein
MRRLRKSGAVDPATGAVVVIPRLPPVTGANRPPGWDRWRADEKVEHLLGLSLDRMREYLAWLGLPMASIPTGWRRKHR